MALVALAETADDEDLGRTAAKGWRRRRQVVAFGGEPANAGAGKAAVQAFGLVAGEFGVGDQKRGAAGAADVAGWRFVPDLNAVQEGEHRFFAEKRQPVDLGEVAAVKEKGTAAQGGPKGAGDEGEARLTRGRHRQAQVGDGNRVAQGQAADGPGLFGRFFHQDAGHEAGDAGDAAMAGAESKRRERRQGAALDRLETGWVLFVLARDQACRCPSRPACWASQAKAASRPWVASS